MELTPGDKRTEIGVLPEDWDVDALQNLVDPVRTIRYGIVQPGRYDPAGRYMVRGQDYSKGWVGATDVFRVSAAVEEPFANARVHTGDVLMTIVGASTGCIAVVPDWLDGANLTQTTARIALRSDRIDGTFGSYVLASAIGSRQVANYLKGAAQPGLNCGDIEKFLIPLPPLPEQLAIAKVLRDVDSLLEELTQLVAKKRDLKDAAVQQLLTANVRLPGFEGAWELKPFDDVLRRMNVKSFQIQASEYELSGKYPVVDQGKQIIVGYSDRDDRYLHCPDGGVIVFGDHTCIVKFVDFDFLVGADGTQILRGRPGACTRFVAYQLQHRGVEATGYNRHFKFLKERVFISPSEREQTAIADVLSDIDAELSALEARLAKTRLLKRAMMQELLTGRTRLV